MTRLLRHGSAALIALAVVGLPSGGPATAQEIATDQAILVAQRLIQRRPQSAAGYARLGDAYIQKSRQTGDLSYLTLAEQALRRALDLAPGSAAAARHLAYVFSSRHEFKEGAAQARRAIELDPGDGHARGVLGDALLELGEYEDAARAFDAMSSLDTSLYSLSRRSGLTSVHGDPEGAAAELRRAIETGRTTGEPRESLAWAQWQLGAEHFAVGRLDLAEARYRDALRTFPSYYRALGGLAQVRAGQQRYDEAIELYRQALGVIPLPEYATALGDLHTRLGQPHEARKQYALVEYIGRLNAINRVVYNRELAYFYADHDLKPDEALALARAELEVRRDIYGYDVLAWALYKSGKTEEALAAMREALRLGTRDARLFFHAGMIHRDLGHRDQAREFLARALSTNPYFNVLQTAVAQHALAELADR